MSCASAAPPCSASSRRTSPSASGGKTRRRTIARLSRSVGLQVARPCPGDARSRRIDVVARLADAVHGPADLEDLVDVLLRRGLLGERADLDQRLRELHPVLTAPLGVARPLQLGAVLAQLCGGFPNSGPALVGFRPDVALGRLAVHRDAFDASAARTVVARA